MESSPERSTFSTTNTRITDIHNLFIGQGRAIPSFPVFSIVAVIVLAVGATAIPAAADGFILRKGLAIGENGAVGRSRGIISNGEGEGAVRRGGFALDGEGNGVAGSGGCIDGQSVNGCKGRGANWNSDGSFTAESGAGFSGDNGFFNGSRTLERDADGNVTAGRSVDAAGENGAYSGDSSFEDGTYNRDGTYSGDEGQSASVEGNWALGSGGSRAVT